jgi:hypothetical protein
MACRAFGALARDAVGCAKASVEKCGVPIAAQAGLSDGPKERLYLFSNRRYDVALINQLSVIGKMPDPEEDDAAVWFRPPWATESELAPPGPPHPRKAAPEPDHAHPLLSPLARAQDALARLETRAECASPAVAEGLRARLAYQEAAGWLAQAHIWIHPRDLALRDGAMTGSCGVAALAGRLGTALPATLARGSELDAALSDIAVDQALRLARLWRRLAEVRSWKPLVDADAMRAMLEALGARGARADTEIADWLAMVHLRDDVPALIRAGRAARDWTNRPCAEPRASDGVFLAACLWRNKGFGQTVSLPFWSAPDLRHNRLTLGVGTARLASFLECVAAAARIGSDELARLQRADAKGGALPGTARSRLSDALDAVLRAPVVTVRGLAQKLGVSRQAALGLLRQLTEAGIVREASGRASWRVFELA